MEVVSKLITFFIILLVVGIYMLFIYPSSQEVVALKNDVQEKEIQSENLQRQLDFNKNRIKALKTNKKAIEEVARERYGYCLEEEEVYDFRSKDFGN